MRKSPSYCIEGLLQAGGKTKALSFGLENTAAASGMFGDSGSFGAPPGGISGADGKVRLCGLTPGEYKITAFEWPSDQMKDGPPSFGTTRVTITDRDVTGVRLGSSAPIPVPGHVVWDGKPPNQPVDSKLSLWLQPLTRASYGAEFKSFSARSSIPGEFSFPGLSADDYQIHLHGLIGDLYVKDITYAGLSILHQPMSLGRAIGAPDLRIVIGCDGGHVQAIVQDKDGNPILDSYIFLIPADASSEALLPDVMNYGQADQTASFTSSALVPGKYLAFAATRPADPPTPDTVGKLWQARYKAQEIEVNANATADVTLILLALER